MIILIIGGIVLGLAILFAFLGKYQSNKSLDIRSAQTYSAEALQQNLNIFPEGMACEVKGVIECDRPLLSPMTKQPCVSYNYQVERRYEERDSDGSSQTRSETVHQDSQRVNFWVRDETGRVLILPEKAQIEMQQSATHFENSYSPSMGLEINLSRGTVGFEANSGATFHYTEQVLTPGQRVYVLGNFYNYQGQAALAAKEKQRFLISWRSEEELVQSAGKWMVGFYSTAGALAVIGAGLVAFGIVR